MRHPFSRCVPARLEGPSKAGGRRPLRGRIPAHSPEPVILNSSRATTTSQIDARRSMRTHTAAPLLQVSTRTESFTRDLRCTRSARGTWARECPPPVRQTTIAGYSGQATYALKGSSTYGGSAVGDALDRPLDWVDPLAAVLAGVRGTGALNSVWLIRLWRDVEGSAELCCRLRGRVTA
jgi:hypothetical protein